MAGLQELGDQLGSSMTNEANINDVLDFSLSTFGSEEWDEDQEGHDGGHTSFSWKTFATGMLSGMPLAQPAGEKLLALAP